MGLTTSQQNKPNKLNCHSKKQKSPLDLALFQTEPITFFYPSHLQNPQINDLLPSTFKTEQFPSNQIENESSQTSLGLIIKHSHIFSDLYEGFKLWEGGIVMSRFMLLNPQLFQNKTILELGAGVGVCGLTACKYLDPAAVTMTDYLPEVMELLQQNTRLNLKELRVVPQIEVLDWNQEVKQGDQKYQVVLGSELVYSITNCDNLANMAYSRLEIGGVLIMMIPTCRAYGNQFFEALDRLGKFQREDQILEEKDVYLFSPVLEFYFEQKQQWEIEKENQQEMGVEDDGNKGLFDKKIDEMTYSLNCKDPFYPLRNLTFRLIALTKLQ